MLSARTRPESIAEKIAVTVRYKTGFMASYDRNGKRIHMQTSGGAGNPGCCPHQINPSKLDEIWMNDRSVERVIVCNGSVWGILYNAPLFDKSSDKIWRGETGRIKVQVADKGFGCKIIIYIFLFIAACFLAPYKPGRES